MIWAVKEVAVTGVNVYIPASLVYFCVIDSPSRSVFDFRS